MLWNSICVPHTLEDATILLDVCTHASNLYRINALAVRQNTTLLKMIRLDMPSLLI